LKTGGKEMSYMTAQWIVGSNVDEHDPGIREAARLLLHGETVAFPTETVYGLGADARNTQAVERIYAAKGRPSDNPLIVHLADRAGLADIAMPGGKTIERLLDAFWPGPLTVVLPARPGALSPRVTAGLPTVAVRVPAHPAALALLRAAAAPIAAPSANRSGRPSPTNAAHVRADLDGRIAGIVDGGPCGVGLESTVVEAVGGALHILRPGGVTAAELRRVLPGVPVVAAAEHALGAAEAPRSPGMKYAHYAPNGRLTLVQGAPASVAERIRRELAVAAASGECTGVLTFAEHAGRYPAGCADVTLACGRLSDPATIARQLFAALRRFDEASVTCIFAECCDETSDVSGVGAAVMNRLRKASGGRVIQA
jgi:L-threonylcarbamoyladenylate synthase